MGDVFNGILTNLQYFEIKFLFKVRNLKSLKYNCYAYFKIVTRTVHKLVYKINQETFVLEIYAIIELKNFQ